MKHIRRRRMFQAVFQVPAMFQSFLEAARRRYLNRKLEALIAGTTGQVWADNVQHVSKHVPWADIPLIFGMLKLHDNPDTVIEILTSFSNGIPQEAGPGDTEAKKASEASGSKQTNNISCG